MIEKGNKAKETSSKAPKADDMNGAELMEGGPRRGEERQRRAGPTNPEAKRGILV